MRSPLLMVAAFLASSALHAQTPQYQPSGKNPDGREIVGVFISSSWCVGNRAPGLHEAVERAKLLLRDRATAAATGFRAVGLALDWQVDTGRTYLAEFGAFDEIGVGSNWFGLGPETLVWADSSAPSSIPQFVVYEHDVTSESHRVRFSARRVLKRVHGGDKIVEWVRAGAPVP